MVTPISEKDKHQYLIKRLKTSLQAKTMISITNLMTMDEIKRVHLQHYCECKYRVLEDHSSIASNDFFPGETLKVT